MVFSMACRNAVFLVESLSMSKYDVVARRGWWKACSSLSSSMMTHSELPVKESSLSWNMRCEDPELMVLIEIG